jgi:hypothetical protein
MLIISLLIPLSLAYSLYDDQSETALLSSDMSLEDPGGEDLSIYQNEFNVFVPVVSSITLLSGAHSGRESCLFSSPLTSHSQNKPVLRLVPTGGLLNYLFIFIQFTLEAPFVDCRQKGKYNGLQ